MGAGCQLQFDNNAMSHERIAADWLELVLPTEQ